MCGPSGADCETSCVVSSFRFHSLHSKHEMRLETSHTSDGSRLKIQVFVTPGGVPLNISTHDRMTTSVKWELGSTRREEGSLGLMRSVTSAFCDSFCGHITCLQQRRSSL